MALLEFSITPLGAGESVSQYVARAVDIVDKSGLDYRLHAMGTVVEGDVGQLLDVLKKCVEAVAVDCDRVSVSAKLDYRKGHAGALGAKVASVETRLGRAVKK
ncbi:MAG: MTH1187 family thiamine-binding protein [Pirellulales bacterium]